MTRPEFDNAVKDALRHYRRADLLVGNQLSGIQIMRQRGSATISVRDPRAMLSETAKTRFGSDRDKKIYRVLDLTYFNPAPKQEAAANRLGLSFSTFRHYLGDPGITIREFSDARSSVPSIAVSPVYRREMQRVIDGLRSAGMPD